MLLSDSREFIFVHNYKVAGTSIRHALRPFGTPLHERTSWFSRQLAKLGLHELSDCTTHAKARDIRDQFPERWEQYFTFGFVRNPWSWQVSLYFYMLQNEGHWFHEKAQSMSGFDEYIEWRVRNDRVLQSSFFQDENGDFIVDFIGRLENIREDFQSICSQIDIDAQLPHRNPSSHTDYRDYYDEHTKTLVEEHFTEDILTFGYSFDGTVDETPRPYR